MPIKQRYSAEYTLDFRKENI